MKEECECFRDTIEYLRLVDLSLGLGRFIWNNKWRRYWNIAFLLDIFLVSQSVMGLEIEIHASVLPVVSFNNRYVELCWSGLGYQFKKPF